MKREIEAWIEAAAQSADLSVKRIENQEAAKIEQRARSKFVAGNPRVWWLSLAEECQTFDSKTTNLEDVLPEKNGEAWLIPETDSEHLPVYSIELAQLAQLLDECPYFEYNVVGNNFGWLLAESDHNVYFLCLPKGRA